MPSVEATLDKYQDQLLAYPNVNGVGIQQETTPHGLLKVFIQVYVTQLATPEGSDVRELIPKTLDDVEVRVREIGRLRLE